eukprot:TRINITY_DN7829_c0_g2_i1.p1 TRINITY_DN7829_c0_g2~~TRINITY_DN7829_c0_g2_i1.p1  ORF type:complete len:498 (+),score=80.62 TRINITY_DN7829_c0_g2_i1:242-1735(+)
MVLRAVFLFPSASGHLNPSLPLARELVSLGWEVEYLAIPQFKEAIEDTGALFQDRNQVCSSLGCEDVVEMIKATFGEYDDPGAMQWALNFGSIAAQRLLPVYIDWFRERQPNLVVYCPVLCQVAHFAALHLKIPDVSLLTAAGPGFFDAALAAHPGASAAALVGTVAANQPNRVAVEALRDTLGLPELSLNTKLDHPLISDYYTGVNIVSTTIELADELNEKDSEFYETAGKKFFYMGPLLDVSSARRACGVLHASKDSGESSSTDEHAKVMSLVNTAAANSRQVAYVSMGTVLTGADAEHGWCGTSGSGLTGKQLCQSVYRAVFQELQAAEGCGILIVVSLGLQPDALEGLHVPANAVCVKSVPQLDLLRNGRPALFVTNGGQNSLMESLAVGTPVVVCPGFGDQKANGAKVVARGWGTQVERPPQRSQLEGETMPSEGDMETAYQGAVQSAVRDVLGNEMFAAKAKVIEASLQCAEGVEGAVHILLDTAMAGGCE